MALNTQIGRRRQIILIKRLEIIPDEGGGSDSTLVDYWKTWAEVKEVRATRVAESYQDRLKKVFSVKIRYRKDKVVSSDMRIVIKGKEYAIDGNENIDERDGYIEIIAVASKV
ncbi:phage head closure protein [Sphingobacterium sp. InxBP1]|uniref:phage head closure protein n=1 Tax=Sphingobacterium sp. InxBP1 TaxID=2870328 RepID=UPI0022443765|nr:phage head closure protein [Sphingobacterium sp. InxBP1]